jgi:hypothetical protein
MELTIEDCDKLETYHKGKPTQARQIPLEERRFIAWDGEGINLNGSSMPQSYILFGCSTGEYISNTENITVFEIIDFMLNIGEANVGAIHIGFAFDYDANMIIRTLHTKTLERLHKNGSVYLKRPDGIKYRVEWRPRKWLQVTRFNPTYSATNTHAKTTVRIYDIFSFFNKSFIAAYEGNVGPVPEIIEKGKAKRSTFTVNDLTDGTIYRYWSVEIKMMQELAEELRKRLYGAGLRISLWHGPGALASYELRRHNIKDHMKESPDEVREASRYAYMGGRFEMYSLGRHHGPIYSMDINSAYPHAIRLLPGLSTGNWTFKTGTDLMERKSLRDFGVYRIRMQYDLTSRVRGPFGAYPSPLFHRDLLGNITYPWRVNGWYWCPEAIQVLRSNARGLSTLEGGWEYETEDASRPFKWVEDTYNLRQEWKTKKYPSEMALKLLLNSMYGKMAQRIGWDEEKRKGPTYHQLEWAGWVTSNCRAMLWNVMSRIPHQSLIAVETDGLYTTTDPATIGIRNSKELGGWEVEKYDEILYVQSGLAWLRKGNCKQGCEHTEDDRKQKICAWICKRRGLDARTFELNDCISYLSSLGPRQKWAPYIGETTRFVGLGAAIQSAIPTKKRLGVWETKTREITPGLSGKRLHMFSNCAACSNGKTAYEAGHTMIIKPIRDPESYPHDIPWEDGYQKDFPWRIYEDEMRGLVINNE